jgi:YcxB-like protein
MKDAYFNLIPEDWTAFSAFLQRWHVEGPRDDRRDEKQDGRISPWFWAAAAVMTGTFGFTIEKAYLAVRYLFLVLALLATVMLVISSVLRLYSKMPRRRPLSRLEVEQLRGQLFAHDIAHAEDQQVQLSAEGVSVIGRLRTIVTRWAAIEVIVPTETHLFLLDSPTTAIIVPRRAFEEAADFDAFVRTALDLHRAAIDSRPRPNTGIQTREERH